MKKIENQIATLNFPLVIVMKFGILLSIILIAPLLGNQLLTGTIVNAILFISTFIFGVSMALFLAVVPSLIASLTGILPVIIFPMIPFIIISNIILIFSFNYFKNKYWLGIFLSSFFKFSFLFFSGYLMLNLILPKSAVYSITTITGWYQLITVLSGGILAYLYLKITKKI